MMSVAWILFNLMGCLFLASIALVLLICVVCLVIAAPFVFKGAKKIMQEWLDDFI